MTVENKPSFYFKNTETVSTAANTNVAQNMQSSYQSAPKQQLTEDKFEAQDKKGLSTGAKVGIAAAVISAVAGGIYLYKSGKGNEIIAKIKDLFNKNGSKIKNNTSNIVNATTSSTANTAKEGTKIFKDSTGNIVEGIQMKGLKAIDKNGKPFTGTLNAVKKGQQITIEYKKGQLISHTKGDIVTLRTAGPSILDYRVVETFKYNKKTNVPISENEFQRNFEKVCGTKLRYGENPTITRTEGNIANGKLVDKFQTTENIKNPVDNLRYINEMKNYIDLSNNIHLY